MVVAGVLPSPPSIVVAGVLPSPSSIVVVVVLLVRSSLFCFLAAAAVWCGGDSGVALKESD